MTCATEYTSFDILGRVTGHKQMTDGQAYTTAYVYNLSGALVEQTYPSGRVVKNVLDNKGDLEMVQSKKNSSAGYWSYARNFTYNAAGAVTSMQLGNGRWESTQFNSRLQPTQIALGATPNATNLLKLDYTYGTTQNNGNLLSQTITVPSVTIGGTTHNGFTAVQNYAYDVLNRLDDAAEYIDGSPTPSWRQDFTFDRYGNRSFVERNTTFEGFEKLCASGTELCADLRKIMNPSVNQSNNRLSSSDGYVLDPAGNTVRDPQGRRFTYDGENKQVTVETLDANGNPVSTVGEYEYDGDGKRVKKYVPSTGETTIFVYDAGGKLVAEYSTIVARVEDAKVAYLTNDHLGSPRINTDKNGNVTARHDYHPFGEEIATSQRTASLYYSEDTVRKQFTGYERDLEVDLDYAKARMYASKLGRFTTTDPSQKSVDKISPQTWNRYTYCYNNPLTLVDENGKWPTGTHSRIINQALNTMSEKFRSAVRWGSIKTDYPGTVLERNAHKHAMTPASYITKTCDVDCAKGKARQAATEFVNANLNKAAEKFKEAQKYGQGSDQGVALVKESLTYFGRAIHTVMDNVSPAHGGFQIFTGYTTTFATNAAMGAASGGGIAGALVSGVAGTAQDISDHNKTEERDPTPQEYDVMSDRIRVLFQEVYGQDAYNSSVSEEERKKTRERSSQPGFSVVF